MIKFKTMKKAVSFFMATVMVLGMATFTKPLTVLASDIDDMSASKIEMGDIVYFGSYPQTSLGTTEPTTGAEGVDWVKRNDKSNNNLETFYKIEPIAWRVLDVSGGEALLISEKTIDGGIPYHTSNASITWEKSTIRAWLNNYNANSQGESAANPYSDTGFIGRAFTSDEEKAIKQTTVINDTDNDPSNDENGVSTSDKIFLLSINEATTGNYDYFAGNADRIAAASNYATAGHGYTGNDVWWLRSPGNVDYFAAVVDDVGSVFSLGNLVVSGLYAVRPALKLNLSSVIFTSEITSDGDTLQAKPWMTDAGSSYTAEGGAKIYKIGVLGNNGANDYELSNIQSAPTTVEYNEPIEFKVDSNTANLKIMYRISDTSDNILSYGVAKDNTTVGENEISFIPKDLTTAQNPLMPNTGNKLEIWLQKDNLTKSHEVSEIVQVVASLPVTQKALADSMITAIPDQTHTGSAIEPTLTVTHNGVTLVKGTDYSVAYTNNTNVGTATATITGMGNYTGTATANFTIDDSYIITATPMTLAFPSLTTGYTTTSPLTVTINNTGTGDIASLAVAPEGTNANSFILGTLSNTSVATGSNVTFTVQPKTGLSTGTYTATAKVTGSNETTVSVPISFTVNASSSGGGGSTSSGSTTTKKPEIIINGNKDTSKIDTTKDKHTINVTPEKNADGSYKPAEVTIPASVLTSVLSDTKNRAATFFIEIVTPYGTYQVPVNLADIIPNLKELLAKNNLKAEDISFKITLTDKSTDADIKKAFKTVLPNGEVLGAIVDFKIEIVNNKTGKSLDEAKNFTNAITRLIPMPKDMKNMPSQWGGFKYNETTKKFEFVASKKIKMGDVWYVAMSSYTNSTYVVAENNVKFSDVKDGAWYTPFVEQAAAKGLVQGVGNGLYEPSREVTRAEFVQMLVNAMQLNKINTGEKPYDDVSNGAWYYDAIMKAKSAGWLDKLAIVPQDANANEVPGMFRPNEPITREEMAVILAAAVKTQNIPMTLQAVDLSTVFKDYSEFGDRNINDIELIYRLKIMQGVGGGKFEPNGVTTRAQAATVQINLLKALKMID